MGQGKGMRGYDALSSSQNLFETSLVIADPLDMSMEGLPLTSEVNIHLQTPTKVEIYPVIQEGQQEQLEEQQHEYQHQQQHQDKRNYRGSYRGSERLTVR
ncbi:hypothetical protein E2C01_076572 [Portunus trituberculatus]|uniref:Uncharacterized protein n=1 Tax=Portunus trituberculatus TaxID=210409 RepID=A0A5B7I918_PORTR|nr:hypothetical protein [Portunus trituberculatus]